MSRSLWVNARRSSDTSPPYVPELTSAAGLLLQRARVPWSDTIGDFFTFLRCNRDHHAINLMQSAKRQGLFHVAFEMRDFMHLKDQLDHIASSRAYA